MHAELKKIVYQIDDNYVLVPPQVEAENIDDNIKTIFDNPSFRFIRKAYRTTKAKRVWGPLMFREFITES